jgi:hypothetical protein
LKSIVYFTTPLLPEHGPGVFVGHGKGVVPMENPSAQTRCPVLDGVSYCY